MAKPTRYHLLQMVEQMERQLSLLKDMIKQELPEREWLTTKEFAEFSKDLSQRTVSTYCSERRFGKKQRKNEKGFWEIHISQL